MRWSEGDIDVSGVRLHYYRRGSGRPIVAAHGFGDNGRCWERVARDLERDHEFVAYDARSHGLSDAAPAPSAGPGGDIIAVAQALGLEKPAILGHSMGAGAVADAAAMRPDLFACVILEDPGWRSPTQASVPRGPRPDYSAMTVEQVEAQGRARSPGWHDIEWRPWAESKLQLRTGTAVAALTADPMAWRQTAQKMSGLPALLITADTALGSIVTPETAAEAQGLCPTLEVVRLEGAGHNIRREVFDGFMIAVRAFLAKRA